MTDMPSKKKLRLSEGFTSRISKILYGLETRPMSKWKLDEDQQYYILDCSSLSYQDSENAAFDCVRLYQRDKCIDKLVFEYNLIKIYGSLPSDVLVPTERQKTSDFHN